MDMPAEKCISGSEPPSTKIGLQKFLPLRPLFLPVQFTALSVATEGAAPGEVPGSGRMFPAASVS
jgi:hypothetical protein